MGTDAQNGAGTGLAVILARRGSAGVPGKNWLEIAGRPCVWWTIDQALRSRSMREVVVSTDAPEVAAVARSMGVAVIERPGELADATATVDGAARHALGHLSPARPWLRDADTPVVVLYGNVPVRPERLIDRAVGELVRTRCDSVQSYAPVGKHHPWWMVRFDDAEGVEGAAEGVGRGSSGAVRAWEGETLNHGVYRRQDLPPAYLPDGGVLVVRRAALMLEVEGAGEGPHAFFGVDRRGVRTRLGEVVDIDEPADVVRAERALAAYTAESAGGRGAA